MTCPSRQAILDVMTDGDGYFIRDDVIIVPKDGVIKPGTRV
jgi:hypothetical protein